MRGKRRVSSESDDDSEQCEEKYATEHSNGKPVLGDIIWAKLYGGSWWPGVIVDENAVTGSSKPDARSTGDVLVRPYGSYEYVYVNPVRCHSGFEIELEQNNGSCLQILKKALAQDLPYLKSGRSTGQGSNSKGPSNGRGRATKVKKSNENKVNPRLEASNNARVSVRKERNAVAPYQNIKDDDSLSKDVEEAINLDGVIKKLNLNSPDSVVEKSKRRMRNQDDMQKEQKKTGSKAKEVSNKTSKQNRAQKRLKQNGQGAAAEECQSPEQDEELNTAEPNTPNSGGTFFGRLQELRARKAKVMKTLGLTPPSGSPFQ